MFEKKIFFLAAGYLAGNVVSSVYSSGKKKGKKVEKKENITLMLEDFLTTQKNFISDIEKKYLSSENQKSLKKKKKEFLKYSEKYIKQGQDILEEVSKNEKIIAGKNKAGGFLSDIRKKAKVTFSEFKDKAQTEEKKK